MVLNRPWAFFRNNQINTNRRRNVKEKKEPYKVKLALVETGMTELKPLRVEKTRTETETREGNKINQEVTRITTDTKPKP